MQQPQSLLPSPASAADRPGTTPVPEWNPHSYAHAPRQQPTAVVSQSESRTELTLSAVLVQQVPGLRGGSVVLLVAPRRRGGRWYLDTRPKAGQGMALPTNPGKGYQVRVPRINAIHFLKARPVAAAAGQPFTGNQNIHLAKLVFLLGEQLLEEVCVKDENGRRVCEMRPTGYYELLPVG